VWSWRLDAGVKSAELVLPATVTKSPITEESAKETVKTIARGMPGVSGATVVTMLVCFFILHARLRAHRAPGIPCALVLGREVHAPLGRIRAAGMQTCK
jgi:hypothetical protein